MNFFSLIRGSALASIAALAVSAPAYATWGAFGAAVNSKGQIGTCTFTTNGVTRRGSVEIKLAILDLGEFGQGRWDYALGKNTTSAHSANVGIFYVDTGIAGPWNFFYEEKGGLAPGQTFQTSRMVGENKLTGAQCRVGNGSL